MVRLEWRMGKVPMPRDPYIPNQIVSLMQSLENALDLLKYGGGPEQIQQAIKLGNEILDSTRDQFEPEWERISDLLGQTRFPEPVERILCAAIHADDGKRYAHQVVPTGIVFCGHRHHNIFAQLQPLWGFLRRDRIDAGLHTETQGFLTSTGHFVGRKMAMNIAKAADQVLEGKENLLPGGKLDSGGLY